MTHKAGSFAVMPPLFRHSSRRTPSPRSLSRSPSPDPEIVRYLSEQKRPCSPESEAFRSKRIATSGVFNVKSKHQRDKEEAEKKRHDEEIRAKRAYEEFVQDMQGDDRVGADKRRSFVRAGGSSSYETESRRDRRDDHNYSVDPPIAPRSMRRDGPETTTSRFTEEGDPETQAAARRKDPQGKRLGIMGDFLGEIQRNQAEREERLRSKVSSEESISTLLAKETGGSSRPWDSSDPTSSNVCVLNLPANVTEDSLAEYFSKYGDVASVKIMWPRTADDMIPSHLRSTKSPGATGFVNFMYRSDAEKAYRQIEGSEWMGCLLRTGWGKALKKPVVPMYSQATRSKEGNEGQERSVGKESASRLRSSRSPSSRKHRRVRQASLSTSSLLEDMIRSRQGEDTVARIRSVASRVKEHGKSFEVMLQEREAGNPLFAFLSNSPSDEHEFYRSCLDASYEPVVPAAAFQDDGEASLYSSDTEEESEQERLQSQDKGKTLGKAARRRLEAMLRSITMRRERIARVMLFAIEHAMAAETVVDIISESLLQPATPLSRKLARLYVVSDILHNSSVSASNAWRYRSLFEKKLHKIFMHWGDVANSFVGRIKRESCKEMARNTMNVWDNWLIYESAKTAEWKRCIDTGSSRTSETQMAEE